MNEDELMQEAPSRRIEPYDGMAVTADVWTKSHDYHRRHQRLHAMLPHGSGIVTGLRVTADKDPSTMLNISPGMAVDPEGNLIVLRTPKAHNAGSEISGLLYVLIAYAEGQPHKDPEDNGKDAPLYRESERKIFVARSLPTEPCIELARIRRSDRHANICNADDAAAPGLNEIDLRFRREIGAPRETRVAVTYLGESYPLPSGAYVRRFGNGVALLARSLNREGRFSIWVEDDVRLKQEMQDCDLVYVAAEGCFQSPELNALLRADRTKGPTLLLEASDEEAWMTMGEMLKSAGIRAEPPIMGDRILTDPYFFAKPPPGYDHQALLVDKQRRVICSPAKYGLLWQGECHDGLASREQIRSAVEWGGNIMVYAAGGRAG